VKTLPVGRRRLRAIGREVFSAAAAIGLLVAVPALVVAQQDSSLMPMPPPTNKPATLTFEQLRRGVGQNREELWALEVEYEVRSTHTGGPWPKFHFAMKGEKRRRDRWEPIGGLYGQTYSDTSEVWDRKGKHATIKAGKYEWVDVDSYADALALAVSDSKRARAVSLTSILHKADLEWTVKPTLESVDGADCHVLECKGFLGNRIWIDPQLGFAMRFQETHQPIPEKPNVKRPLLARYRYREFEKVPPGVYLPRMIDIVAYNGTTTPESMWNQVTFTQTLNVTKLAVGQHVDDGLFRFAFTPGTRVQDHVRDRFYRIGRLGEELDMMVGKGREELGKGRSPFRSRAMLVLIGNGAILLGAAAWLIYRRRRSAVASGG
jgi:hypothetical protein